LCFFIGKYLGNIVEINSAEFGLKGTDKKIITPESGNFKHWFGHASDAKKNGMS